MNAADDDADCWHGRERERREKKDTALGNIMTTEEKMAKAHTHTNRQRIVMTHQQQQQHKGTVGQVAPVPFEAAAAAVVQSFTAAMFRSAVQINQLIRRTASIESCCCCYWCTGTLLICRTKFNLISRWKQHQVQQQQPQQPMDRLDVTVSGQWQWWMQQARNNPLPPSAASAQPPWPAEIS